MATIKAYLYCCRGGYLLCDTKQFYTEDGRCKLTGEQKEAIEGKKYVLANNRFYRFKSLNGTVCFECEIEKAEKIVVAPFPFANGDYQYASKTLTPDALEARSCLSVKELNDYDPRHALYLTNVKEIEPFKIPSLELIKDNVSTSWIPVKSLSRAPQNMCWAWAWNDEERKWERVLVLSIRPENLCNIANGLKDIETRRQVVNEIKEMEK